MIYWKISLLLSVTPRFLDSNAVTNLFSNFWGTCSAFAGKNCLWVYLLHERILCCCCCKVASVVSDSVRPQRRQPTRLPGPWDSPGKNTGLGCHFLLQSMEVKSESEVAQLCLTLSEPMDYSLPGSSIHGIFQARVLEWVAIAFSSI